MKNRPNEYKQIYRPVYGPVFVFFYRSKIQKLASVLWLTGIIKSIRGMYLQAG